MPERDALDPDPGNEDADDPIERRVADRRGRRLKRFASFVGAMAAGVVAGAVLLGRRLISRG